VLPNQCGDGVVWGAESCDDGNTASNDGCSDACGVAMGWSCDGANPTVCLPVCSDNIDNDGDGLVDFPNDPGCRDSSSKNEKPQCQDGRDNDGDGAIDFDGGAAANGGVALGAPDTQCNLPSAIEQSAGCGFGFELAFVIPLLMWQRRRRTADGPTAACSQFSAN
jgi:cysteine-rich repeat protein